MKFVADYHNRNSRPSILVSAHTVHLEMNHGLDFKTPKILHHIIYSRFRLDEENPYMKKKLDVLFRMSYSMSVEASFLN